ncbi:MAG: hypothetical protein HGB29_06295 [Chlorobiaceae bacterium]|nr:hypothetical protein [Chlorobiaceae bacterium]NTW74461.1 hypothetical protein [Chlorobiaceae bacterium]
MNRLSIHLSGKTVMIADKTICAAVLLSLGFSGLRVDMMMATVYLLLYPYLYLTSRSAAIKHLLVASLLASCWFFIAKGQYGYNREMLLIGGYTVYPLFAWAVGLFGVYLMYSYWVKMLPALPVAVKFLFFVVLYWAMLFGSEILAYNYFQFRNIATAGYAGLPVFDCIHVPGWMQAAYLLNGPIYFLICELSGFPDPNQQLHPAPAR